MKPQRILDRINLLQEELDAILKNDSLEMKYRARAGRMHIDLLEDYHFCVDKDVTFRVLEDVMKEYESHIMKLYKSI